MEIDAINKLWGPLGVAIAGLAYAVLYLAREVRRLNEARLADAEKCAEDRLAAANKCADERLTEKNHHMAELKVWMDMNLKTLERVVVMVEKEQHDAN